MTIEPDGDAYEALMKISRNAIRQLVVMDGDHKYGMIRRRDIVRYLQLQSENIISIASSDNRRPWNEQYIDQLG